MKRILLAAVLCGISTAHAASGLDAAAFMALEAGACNIPVTEAQMRLAIDLVAVEQNVSFGQAAALINAKAIFEGNKIAAGDFCAAAWAAYNEANR